MQPNLKCAMLGISVKVDPSVPIRVVGKPAPIVAILKCLKTATIPRNRFAVMIVATGFVDKGGPNVISQLVGIGHRTLLPGRKGFNVKVGMEATIPINLKIQLTGMVAKIPNSGKTRIGGKNGRSELHAFNATIFTTVKTGIALKIAMIRASGRF